jgi:hypothetical protein
VRIFVSGVASKALPKEERSRSLEQKFAQGIQISFEEFGSKFAGRPKRHTINKASPF